MLLCREQYGVPRRAPYVLAETRGPKGLGCEIRSANIPHLVRRHTIQNMVILMLISFRTPDSQRTAINFTKNREVLFCVILPTLIPQDHPVDGFPKHEAFQIYSSYIKLSFDVA